jgi:hypothetical protein
MRAFRRLRQAKGDTTKIRRATSSVSLGHSGESLATQLEAGSLPRGTVLEITGAAQSRSRPANAETHCGL